MTLLENSSVLKVGLDISDDVRRLAHSVDYGIIVRGSLDVRCAAHAVTGDASLKVYYICRGRTYIMKCIISHKGEE